MPWTGAGREALELFSKAKELGLERSRAWAKLGLASYDERYYEQALEAFSRAAELTDGNAWLVVWQGHLLDLLGRRDEAVQRYHEALERETGLQTQHDQYGLTINRQWVEKRLEEPFQRR
jgi:tetratricopeptide (TPR) repeat protein